MLLVVGLGNPGPKYERTRHNVGFMVLDRVAEGLKAGPFREKFNGVFTRVSAPDVVLLKPMTYMNLSGESVQAAMKFFKLTPADLLVVYDELDLPFGDCRLKLGGGAAGHNGIKSLLAHVGGDGFAIRQGIWPGYVLPFVEKVIPLLQQRGAVRTEYTGTTLREHLREF